MEAVRRHSGRTVLDARYPSTDERQSLRLHMPYLDARTELNRWLPLVKWPLAIPHYVVLVFLGIAAFVSIVIAWFAILFTGRYPRGLFDFVVGVGRWGVRVTAYAFLLVTDRNPPFSLSPSPPAAHRTCGAIASVRSVSRKRSLFTSPPASSRPTTWRVSGSGLSSTSSNASPCGRQDLLALPAQEPANERTEQEPGFRRKRDIGRHADEDAERQAQHGAKPDGGSHAHPRESTFDESARLLRPACC